MCLLDREGALLASRRIPDGLEGVAQLHALLAEHAETPNEVIIGIETDRGLLVGARVGAGYQLFAINPLAASRYRERHTTSRAKSDRGDAKVLAAPLVADAYASTVAALIGVITGLSVQNAAVEATLVDRVEQHPDAAIGVQSAWTRQHPRRPGAGRVVRGAERVLMA